MATVNRPGRTSLSYRAGTHATFLETMLASISGIEIEAGDQDPRKPPRHARPLANLATRAPDDPAIALLDAWAVVGDILTFYQERIANEGYLRTATERQSVVELARLIGYEPRPGVAASVYAAYTLQEPYHVKIPPGSSVQSVPGSAGESQQTFETSELLDARAEWNQLNVRQTRPLKTVPPTSLILKGTANHVQVGDPLLIDVGLIQQMYRVMRVVTDMMADQTTLTLQPWNAPPVAVPIAAPAAVAVAPVMAAVAPPTAGLLALEGLLAEGSTGGPGAMEKAPSVPPSDAAALQRSAATTFTGDSDALARLFTAMHPELQSTLYEAWKVIPGSAQTPIRVYALRVEASPFGSLAAPKPVFTSGGFSQDVEEWPLQKATATGSEKFFVSFKVSSGAILAANNMAGTLSATIKVGQSPAITIEGPLSTGVISSSTDPAISVNVSPLPAGQPGHRLDFQMHGRSITVEFNPTSLGAVVTNAGRDPTALTFAVEPATGLPLYTVFGSLPVPTTFVATEQQTRISLDSVHDRIVPGGWVVIDQPAKPGSPFIHPIAAVRRVSRSDYGLNGAVTEIDLGAGRTWIDDPVKNNLRLDVVRGTTVYAQSEELPLAGQPIADAIAGASLELASLYKGLEVGRLIIVSGSRADLPGVTSAEVAMISGVTQGGDPTLSNEEYHTTLLLANTLHFEYERQTVTVYGNVVHATHGDTRKEILGSGDPSRAFQPFKLKDLPLTHVSAPTPTGERSTLEVRVNDLLWHEAPDWVGVGPRDRRYTTKVNEDDRTEVIFGDGHTGARPAAGTNNVKCVYRIGIGKAGNVAAGQISLLGSRPMGLMGVINPLAASGGSDPDNRDRIKANAPVMVTALDRLVSVQDYADFARTFAGVGKATAARISDGRTPLIHVTIAGADNTPIGPDSDLLQHLREAVSDLGDPDLAVLIDVRELSLLIISAHVQVRADYSWTAIKPSVERALTETFGFEQRDLGQPAFLSEAISAMQNIPGVDYVTVDVFDGVSESIGLKALTTLGSALTCKTSVGGATADRQNQQIRPAQLVFLDPNQPSTLLISEIVT